MGNKLLMVAGAIIHQLIVAYLCIFVDVPTKFEEKMKKKRRELTPYKRNVSVRYGRPTTALVPQPVLNNL